VNNTYTNTHARDLDRSLERANPGAESWIISRESLLTGAKSEGVYRFDYRTARAICKKLNAKFSDISHAPKFVGAELPAVISVDINELERALVNAMEPSK